MTGMLDELRRQFPGRIMLGLGDVAQALLGRGDRAAQEAVRAGINRGDILPGLRKTLGRWLVPITTLADWMDSLVSSPEEAPASWVIHHHVSDVPTRRRGRQPDSARLPQRQARIAAQRERAAGFFSALLAEFQRVRLAAIPPGSTKTHPTPY